MRSRYRYTAAVLAAPGRFEFASLPQPEPGAGAVRVRLEGCGVCGSNLPAWEGREWFSYPLPPGEPGHEGWGVIDAVGPDVTALRVGARVATLSNRSFAEFEITPADLVVPLPAALHGHEFPGEPLGRAVNILRRAEILPHHHVAIVGVGFLGALLTQLVANTGARTYAIARRPCAQELAHLMGATAVLPMEEHWRVVESINRLTDGAGCDRVIEAVGLQGSLDLAGELVAERGRLVIAGYHQDGPRQVNMQLWNWRGIDVINAYERDPLVHSHGVVAAAAEAAGTRLNATPLFTHRFRLAEIGQAFEFLRDRPKDFFKALVTYS